MAYIGIPHLYLIHFMFSPSMLVTIMGGGGVGRCLMKDLDGFFKFVCAQLNSIMYFNSL